MSWSLVLRPEVQEDIRGARQWYERQRSGLGLEFLDAIEELFARITVAPELYGATYHGVRRGRLRRFPYVVYYRTAGSCIEVLAILHGSRDPRTWQSRS